MEYLLFNETVSMHGMRTIITFYIHIQYIYELYFIYFIVVFFFFSNNQILYKINCNATCVSAVTKRTLLFNLLKYVQRNS